MVSEELIMDYETLIGSFVMFGITLAICIFYFACIWKLFKKAGYAGWKAIIPYYNYYIMAKIIYGNGWLALLLLIPCANYILLFIGIVDWCRVFNKSTGFGVACIFLSPILIPIMAFSKDTYYLGTIDVVKNSSYNNYNGNMNNNGNYYNGSQNNPNGYNVNQYNNGNYYNGNPNNYNGNQNNPNGYNENYNGNNDYYNNSNNIPR